MGPSSVNIENNKTGNNPTGLSTHFNYKNRGENFIRGKTEIRGNTNVHGKFCIHDPSSKYPVCIDSRLITDLNYMKERQTKLEAKLKDMTGQLRELKDSAQDREVDSEVIIKDKGPDKLELTSDDPDVEIGVNATDEKPRKYRNSKLNDVFGGNSYEIRVTTRIDKNSEKWRNIYHYGNKNSERSPSLFIKPKNAWKLQFILRTNKNWNQTYDFEIPKQFRKEGYPLDIRTRVTKDNDSKKITVQQWINNEYIGQKLITESYLAPLYNKDLWIKSPWHNREGYRVEKITFKKIN